jgi:hypothetical protein
MPLTPAPAETKVSESLEIHRHFFMFFIEAGLKANPCFDLQSERILLSNNHANMS